MAKTDTPACKQHGPMILRPVSRMTPEQRYCGTWYDCRQCASSVLIESSELKADLEAMRRPEVTQPTIFDVRQTAGAR